MQVASLLEQCWVCSAAKHRGAGQELTGLQSCWQPGTSKVAGLRKSAGRYRRQKQSLKNTVYLQLHYYLLWIMFFHESFYYRKKKKKKKTSRLFAFYLDLTLPLYSALFAQSVSALNLETGCEWVTLNEDCSLYFLTHCRLEFPNPKLFLHHQPS